MKFGVIGSNFIVKDFLESASLVEDFEYYAMYSRTMEKAEEFSAAYGEINCFDDYDRFLDSGIEALYIASPIAIHEEQAVRALEKGIHVLCEKSVAISKKAIERIIEASEKNNCTFMEAMVSLETPTFKAIEENLHKLGTIRRGVFQYNQYSSRYDRYKKGIVENAFKPELHGGAISDIGIYCIEPAIKLFGAPKSVVGNNFRLSTGAIGQGSGIMIYDDKEVVLMYSKITDSHHPSEILGEEGVMEIDRISRPSVLTITYRDGTVEKIENLNEKPFMYYEVKDFIDCVKNGKISSETNSHYVTLESVKVVESLFSF